MLIGLFTSHLADLQMEAARCLHELSHSSHPDVVEACLPATSYLLTYLSGHSIALIVRHKPALTNLPLLNQKMHAYWSQLILRYIKWLLPVCSTF